MAFVIDTLCWFDSQLTPPFLLNQLHYRIQSVSLSTINYTEYLRKDKKCRPSKAYKEKNNFKLMDKEVIHGYETDVDVNDRKLCNEICKKSILQKITILK